MFIASLVACGFCLGIYGTALWRLTRREERGLILLCLAATLPMCWVMFFGVRRPLDGWLAEKLGKGELLFWIRSAYAPLTEEPAKLWPVLLLPWVRRALTRENAVRFALALGLGFALGEIFTVAHLLADKNPKIAALPWYQLGGFISERTMTGVIHPAMTSIALVAWRGRIGAVGGIALAMLTHFLANLPIGLAQRHWLGPPMVAQAIVSLWVLCCFVVAVLWLLWLAKGKATGMSLAALVHGTAVCPECGQEYQRGLLTGLNAGGTKRYERCPHCRKWHWTFKKGAIA